MTQAYNLSQLANNLNTAGQLDATDGLVGAVPAANGGTGQSTYAVGDLIYASGATALAKLADIATGNVLISGGVAAAPSYGKVGLTTHVNGTLGVTNGGTGATTLTSNAVLIGAGTSAVTSVSPGSSGNVLTSNGTAWASSAPSSGPRQAQYTTNGTFTIPAGVTRVKMTVVGGGGTGATSTFSTGGAGTATGGAGGGGGGAAIKWLDALTPGNTLAVVVGGAGGTSSVSSGTQTITTVSATGNGGIGSSGDLNIRGQAGDVVLIATGGLAVGGTGGSSILGGGGAGGNGAAAGAAGGSYGGGGGGGGVGTLGCGPSSFVGGTGASGLVIIEY